MVERVFTTPCFDFRELSYLEKVLANVKFVDFMKTKRLEAEQKKPKKPEATIFKVMLILYLT